MSKYTLAQLQNMSDDELLGVEPETVNEADYFGLLLMLFARLEIMNLSLEEKKQEIMDLEAAVERERSIGYRWSERVYALEDEVYELRGEIDGLKEALENAK